MECLKHDIRYYHKALSKLDKKTVQSMFKAGAIQVLVASKVRFVFLAIWKGFD